MFVPMMMRLLDPTAEYKPEPSRSGQEAEPVSLPSEVAVKRSDPVYNAHAYLTKVPVTAIEPFLEAFTNPEDLVLDMYGGSGMTGVAAAMHGRRAEIRDISALGRHIGSNYLNLVDEAALRTAARGVIEAARERLGDVYAMRCGHCGGTATLSRTVWSYIYGCQGCHAPVNYYEAYEASGWEKKNMKCQSCEEAFSARRSTRIDEEPVLDTITCACSKKLRDCEHTDPLHSFSVDGLSFPDVAIGEDRQMFQASALGKHGLITTATFFSERNLAALTALHGAIGKVGDGPIRDKLLFAFTGILSRTGFHGDRFCWFPI